MAASVVNQIADKYGADKRDKLIRFAKEGLDRGYPGIDWVLLDFSIAEEGWGVIEWVDVFDPGSPQISFRVTPDEQNQGNRLVSAKLWSDGKPTSEWQQLRNPDNYSLEIAKMPEFKAIQRVIHGFGRTK